MNGKPVVSAVVALSLTMGGLAFAQGDGDRGEGQQGHRGHEQQGERGAGPDHGWHKGDHLPDEYRNNKSYVVDDWRGHHLHAPPRGYHLVQSGTGVVTQLLLDHRWLAPRGSAII